MNTRRLTKKYKHKSRSKRNGKTRRSGKTRRRGRNGKTRRIGRNGKTRRRGRRIMKGGELNEQEKIKVKDNFLDDFFSGLEHNRFDSALCALHTFYTCGIDISDINKVIRSEEFTKKYASTFFKEVTIRSHTNIEPQERLMFFLSYIYKKITEGATIRCSNGVVLHFTPGTGSFLKILKKFFGYLDTACVLTISYSIDEETFDLIRRSKYATTGSLWHKPISVSNGELALYDLFTSLELLAKTYHELKNDIEKLLRLMTTGIGGENPVFSVNTTNMCTLIKMTQQLFTYFDEP